ncbi:MAG: SDR family oxidoreductase [Pseudomonadota bacterium]
MALNTDHQKAILVTGASSGIGLAACELMAQKGFQVFGGVKPGSEEQPLRDAGAIPLALDVTSMSSLASALETLEARVGDGALWGLVNSAGVVAAGPVELHDMGEARNVFEVNVMGVLATVQTFLPLIRRAGGRIVNLSSLSGLLAVPFLGPYCASKAAIESLSDSMRRELRPLGVDVVAIQPGATRTRMWSKAEEIDLAPFDGTPYGPATAKVKNRAVGKGHRGQSPQKVAEAIHLALTSKSPPTRIRVQRKRLSRLLYSLLPLLADSVVDRKITDAVWSDLK